MPPMRRSTEPSPAPARIVTTQSAIAARLRRLPPSIRAVLRTAGELGDRRGQSVYLVGGAVRDLLLGLAQVDVDLVVEGDGIAFAAAFAEAHGGRLRTHPAFGTAQVRCAEALLVDVATVRTETYAAPGALPTVAHGSIEQDLARRDFTINALALCLNGAAVGRLVDPHGGVQDLRRRCIRVLHPRSFEDDPTRLFRAVRFAARLDCALTGDTRRWFDQALSTGLMARLSPHRLTRELQRMLSERDPRGALRLARSTGLLSAVQPALAATYSTRAQDSVERAIRWYREAVPGRALDQWVVWLLALTIPLPVPALRRLFARCEFDQRVQGLIAMTRRRQRRICRVLSAPQTLAPSRLARLLSGCGDEGMVYVAARCNRALARKRLGTYLTVARELAPLLDGNDLRQLGVPPGPLMAQMLTRLREMQLDGQVRTREDACRQVSRLLRRASARTAGSSAADA